MTERQEINHPWNTRSGEGYLIRFVIAT